MLGVTLQWTSIQSFLFLARLLDRIFLLHRTILPSQQTVVMVSEMIHTASLVHDDVIDGADTRRGKVSVNKTFGEKMSVLAGDYILSCASQALAKLGNSEVVELLAKVVDDLVKGEYVTNKLCLKLIWTDCGFQRGTNNFCRGATVW